jgi:hypothetical protein
LQQNRRRRPRRRRCRRQRQRRSGRPPYGTKHKGYKLKLEAKSSRSTQMGGSLPCSPSARSPKERGRGPKEGGRGDEGEERSGRFGLVNVASAPIR